jgi:hypothetical protein|tara:strand:- start:16 stop:318 length:303 start_codon:yes stop_codon:yes gene_type:complete
MEKEIKTKPKEGYTVVLDVMGKKREAKGKTIEDALKNFKIDWSVIKTKGTLTVKKGSKKHIHFYNMPQLKRIFINKMTRMQQAKYLGQLLEAGKKTNLSI